MNIDAVEQLKWRNIFIAKQSKIPSYGKFRGSDVHIESVPMTGEVCLLAEPLQYTGTNMLGIATLHKSNAVPVFSIEAAVDIANMRR